MPRKQDPKLPPPKLTKSADEVARILQKQIEAGREILARKLDTPSALEEAQEKLKDWYHKNEHYLALLFDNTSKLDDYKKPMPSGPVFIVGLRSSAVSQRRCRTTRIGCVNLSLDSK